MTYYRLIQGGALPSGETWTSRIHVSSNADIDAVMTDWQAASAVLWDGDGGTVEGISTFIPTSVTASSLVVDELDAGTGRATFQRRASATYAGTNVSAPLPQEVSVVVTLRTLGIGPSQRGRIYLPSPASNGVSATARLLSTAQSGMAESAAGMLSSLLGQGHTPVVYHPTLLAGDAVTSVDVGDVFDAQRRRRDKLVEVRVSLPVE